ncbi:MAG: TonB-dependent receptor [Bacteroidales bacterium]|nr:TonB-dependent receptor [Bacteroidales bacterium]
MKKKEFLLTALFFLSIYTAFPQDILKDTISIGEVVVTGSKTPQSPGNVTQKIDIIDRQKIQTLISGNRNIAEALMFQPGASVTALSRNDANWGTNGGIGPKYSIYMLQGLPLDAFVDPMSLDLSAIERIEVQRGPASVLYPNYLSQDFAGNQSPLAGTVNLILKERIDKTLTRFSTAYGSYNTLNGQFYHQGKSENLNYFIGTSYESSDYTNYGTDNSWLNMQKNPLYKKTKLYGGATWFPAGDNKQKFTLFVNKTFHSGDAGRVYRGFDNDYGTINAGYSIDLNDRISLQTHIGLRQYNRTWQESNFGTIDTLKSNNGAVQNIVPADIALTIKHGNANLLTTGIDYQGADYSTWSDPLQGHKSLGNKSAAVQSGMYAQEEIHLSGLILRGGLRYNFIRNNIELVDGGTPGEDSKDWSSFLWSAGIKYNTNPGISIFANAGNSFLTPGLKSTGGTIKLSDLGVPGRNGQLPNPDLKPESGIGIDVGAEAFLPLNFKITVRGFSISVTDAIIDNIVSENPSQTQSVNTGSTSSSGFEIEVNQSASERLEWFINYTYMKTSVQDAGTVPFAPEQVANAGINIFMPFGLIISSYLNYNNGFYDSSDEAGRNFFKPGTLLNLNISQKLAETKNYKLEGFGEFYNLTNNRYEMPWQFRNTGFSVMAGLKASF